MNTYEERYNDLLARLKAMADAQPEVTKAAIESQFPELKESEDERTRKALIKLVKKAGEGYENVIDGVSIENAISWLEKQGEQPKKNDVCNNCDQQGSCVSPCPMKLVEKQGEQKLAEWTAEDEEELKIALNTLEEAGQYSSAKWLKNVCLVPQTMQKPTAWSEEDEELLRDVSDTYFYNDEDYPEETYKRMLKKVLDWMNKRAKFLRPQSHWKPSEEHYELEEFAKIVRGNLTGISKAVQKLFEAKYLQLTGNKMYGGFKD